MKQCPQCNRTYTDDSITFCLADGALLSASYSPEETQRLPLPLTTSPSDRQATSSSPLDIQGKKGSGNPSLMYVVIALLALLLGGGAVALFKSGTKDAAPPTPSPTPSPISESTPISRSERTSVKEEPKTKSRESTPILTINSDAVNKLLARWEGAQDTQDFTAYESCYGYSFKGVLRTTKGRVEVYGFNEWMKDRRRMFTQPGGLDVDAKNIRISLDSDTATVEFDQYYRSSRYRDWGPKIMKIKATPDGDKIVYEELKASYSLD
jgi:hypothetical protein